MRRSMKFSVLVLAVLLVISCASFAKNSYRALIISFNSYDVALSGMGDLYKERLIGDNVRDAAIKYGKAYKIAHNGAVNALAVYEISGGDADKQAVTKYLTSASKSLAELIAYCRPYLTKYNKEVPQ